MPQEPVTPTEEQVASLRQAVLQKATRTLMLGQAPLGYWGELADGTQAPLRPDYAIKEILFGLRFVNWDVDLTDLVTAEDVIRVGLQADSFPEDDDRIADIDSAISAACSWVAQYILGGAGVA